MKKYQYDELSEKKGKHRKTPLSNNNPFIQSVDYLLHGEPERHERSKTKKTQSFHALQIEQHHILLVLACILVFTIYWGFKEQLSPFKQLDKFSLKNEQPTVEQPPVTRDSPASWSVEVPTPVNVANMPSKLTHQISLLYPEAKSTSFRWYRTPKGWSAYYDVEKAKIKFSTEGYWLETEERDFPIKDIPEYLQARVKMAYTSYTLVKAERETISSGKYYELTLKKNRPDNINEEFTVYLNEKANNFANLYEGNDY